MSTENEAATSDPTAVRRPLWRTLGITLGIALLCSVAARLGLAHIDQGRPWPRWDEFFPLVPRAWDYWDAGWYHTVAERGYSYVPGRQSSVAFFPLYPLSMRWLAGVGMSARTAGFALTVGAGIASVVLFHAWARRLVDPRSARRAALLLSVYPFAIYFYGTLYSDAFGLCFTLAAFLCLEHDNPWGAAGFGALATACRPIAPAVVLGLLARSIERRLSEGERLRWTDFVPALSGLGFALWLYYLQTRFGDALAFIHVQSAPGWEHPPGWHTWLKEEWFLIMLGRRPAGGLPWYDYVRLAGHALATVLALGLIWPTRKRLGRAYGLQTLVAIGLPALSTSDMNGMGRYLFAGFPIFLTATLWLATRPRDFRVWIALSVIGVLWLAYAFGTGTMVA